MSSASKSSRTESTPVAGPPTTAATVGNSLLSALLTTKTSDNDASTADNNKPAALLNDAPSETKSTISNHLSWSQIKDDPSKIPNTLDSQKQRLNQLIELISSQEAKLNRLKALRKLAKEQTAINVELNNELKTVNNSISEKDGELRQALNRVDNLNRQLNNYRRTRAYRNSKNVAASKQESKTSDDGSNCESDNSSPAKAQTKLDSLLSNADPANSINAAEASPVREPSPIPDPQDLNKTNIVNSTEKKDDGKSSTINSVLDCKTQLVHNHASPALTKYTNARQKLIGSPLKDKSLSRRVSFDPLAILLDAALEGELDLVIQTSKQVPDLSASHGECVTALHNAVVAGHYEVAKFLIEAGCDINTQDSDGWTPLHCAASCNNLPIVKLLVENGALIYATTTSDYSTPAMKCEPKEEGYEECYEYLMHLQDNLGVINSGVVYALYDYEAQEDDELSFKCGDELVILRRDDSQEQEWWWAQRRIKEISDTLVDIKEGYIPRNLVGLHPRVEAFKKSRNSNAKDNKNGLSHPN